MKKYIITGGSGFIGTNLINYILKKKCKVLNLDKLSYCSNSYLSKNQNKNYQFKRIDLGTCNIKNLSKLIINFKPSIIINLAANSHVDNSINEPLSFVKSNINSTLNLLTAIKDIKRKKQIKFVHIGTDEIYGDLNSEKNKIFFENSRINPSSPYSASKASCNNLVTAFSRTYDISYNIINPSNNFGPFQFPEKLIPKTILKILNNKSVPLYKKGANIRQWMFVEDTCNLIYSFADNKKIINQTINLGHGKLFSNINLIKNIFKILKNDNSNLKLKIKFVNDRKGHDFKYYSSTKKSDKLLKFKSSDFYENLYETIKWYKVNENLKLFKKIKI
jgi:dTDP-glucose 4,6-dehydratase